MTERFRCPYCEYTDDRLGVHSHLLEDHDEQLVADVTSIDGDPGIRFVMTCPECDADQFTKEIPRPRGDPERALETYREELSMIAFDQLLYHLEEAHGY